MADQVIEGTWEEIASCAAKLIQPGKRMKLIIPSDPPDPAPESDPTLDLFDQWEKEDAQMSKEEQDAENRLWEEFERGVNETRAALGMRRL